MKLYRKLCRPGIRKFMFDLDNGAILNCPFTSQDFKIALDIYKNDIGAVRGRALCKKQDPLPRAIKPYISDSLLEHYRNVRLFTDVLYVNQVRFLVTISEYIILQTSAYLENQLGITMLRELKNVIEMYLNNNFSVEGIKADLEFQSIKDDLDTDMNIVDMDAHVHPIERSNRTVKEHIRCSVQGLLFRCLPKGIIIGLVIYSIQNLNHLPIESGISKYMSPLTFVIGAPRPDYNAMELEFGEYVKIYEDNGFQTNSNNTRGTPAIALYPEHNTIGSFWFFSLITGKTIMRGQWTALPMPQ